MAMKASFKKNRLFSLRVPDSSEFRVRTPQVIWTIFRSKGEGLKPAEKQRMMQNRKETMKALYGSIKIEKQKMVEYAGGKTLEELDGMLQRGKIDLDASSERRRAVCNAFENGRATVEQLSAASGRYITIVASYSMLKAIFAKTAIDKLFPEMPERMKQRMISKMPDPFPHSNPASYRLLAHNAFPERKRQLAEQQKRLPGRTKKAVVPRQIPQQPKRIALAPKKPGNRIERISKYVPKEKARGPKVASVLPESAPKQLNANGANGIKDIQRRIETIERRNPQAAEHFRTLLARGKITEKTLSKLIAKGEKAQKVFLVTTRDPVFMDRFGETGIETTAEGIASIAGGRKYERAKKEFGPMGGEIFDWMVSKGALTLHGHDKAVYLSNA